MTSYTVGHLNTKSSIKVKIHEMKKVRLYNITYIYCFDGQFKSKKQSKETGADLEKNLGGMIFGLVIEMVFEA